VVKLADDTAVEDATLWPERYINIGIDKDSRLLHSAVYFSVHVACSELMMKNVVDFYLRGFEQDPIERALLRVACCSASN
jgi:hypothetical protein